MIARLRARAWRRLSIFLLTLATWLYRLAAGMYRLANRVSAAADAALLRAPTSARGAP